MCFALFEVTIESMVDTLFNIYSITTKSLYTWHTTSRVDGLSALLTVIHDMVESSLQHIDESQYLDEVAEETDTPIIDSLSLHDERVTRDYLPPSSPLVVPSPRPPLVNGFIASQLTQEEPEFSQPVINVYKRR